MKAFKGIGEAIGERGIFYFDEEKGEFTENKKKVKKKLHYIQTDEIEPTVSHASFEGKIFTSKSALRRHYKENGFRETGGAHLIDAMERRKTAKEIEQEAKFDREVIEQAYYDVKYARVPFTEQEKEQFKKEERIWKDKYKVKPPA